MARFDYLSISIPQSALVLVSFVLHESEIPKDAQGRMLAQVQQGGGGGSPKSEKEYLFDNHRARRDGAAQLKIEELLHAGFRVNNFCSVPDANREGYFSVRIWMNYNPENGMTLEDWGDAGKFMKDLLRYAWSSPRVVNHNNGKMISFGMYGRTADPHWDRTVITPRMVAEPAPAPAPAERQVQTCALLAGAGGNDGEGVAPMPPNTYGRVVRVVDADGREIPN